MVNISFFIYKTGFFGPFHMLQKKKIERNFQTNKILPTEIRLLTKFAQLREEAFETNLAAPRAQKRRENGEQPPSMEQHGNRRFVVTVLAVHSCGVLIVFFFFVNLVSVLLLSWASFFRTHAQHLLTPFWCHYQKGKWDIGVNSFWSIET